MHEFIIANLLFHVAAGTTLMLLAAGMDPNAKSAKGDTPLTLASFNRFTTPGLVEALNLLIDKGVPVDGKRTDGNTPLHLAVHAGNVAVARYLVNRGARADLHGPTGMTPVSEAIYQRNTRMIEMFIELKAGLNAKADGVSLAEFARKNGQPDIAALLDKASK